MSLPEAEAVEPPPPPPLLLSSMLHVLLLLLLLLLLLSLMLHELPLRLLPPLLSSLLLLYVGLSRDAMKRCRQLINRDESEVELLEPPPGNEAHAAVGRALRPSHAPRNESRYDQTPRPFTAKGVYPPAEPGGNEGRMLC